MVDGASIGNLLRRWQLRHYLPAGLIATPGAYSLTNDLIEEPLPARYDGRGTPLSLDLSPEIQAETAPEHGIGQQAVERPSHSGGVAVGHQQPGRIIRHHVDRANIRRRDNWHASGPCLDQDMRHPLPLREPHQCVEPGHEPRHVWPIAEEANTLREIQLPRQPAQFVDIFRHERIGTADDHKQRLRPCWGYASERLDHIFHPFLAVEPSHPTDNWCRVANAPLTADGLSISRVKLTQVDHRRDDERMVRPVRHPARGGIANRLTDADVAGCEMLGPRQCLYDETTMFDQGWPIRTALQRRVDVWHGLAGHDEVIGGQSAGQVVDGIFERQLVRRPIDRDPERGQLLVRLLWHPRSLQAGDDIKAVARRVEMLRQ